MKSDKTKRLVFASVFLALGIILPQMFMRNPVLGQTFLPMHFPVLLCGLICGWKYGAMCGAVVPLLCSILFAKPPLYPVAIAMCFELCAYGIIAGVLYKKLNINIFISLISAMVGGRIVLGVANVFLYGMKDNPYNFEMFITGAFVKALPGIIIQIIVIPALVIALEKAGLINKRSERHG